MTIATTIAIGTSDHSMTRNARRSPGRGPGSGTKGSRCEVGWRGNSSSPSSTCGSCWTSCSSAIGRLFPFLTKPTPPRNTSSLPSMDAHLGRRHRTAHAARPHRSPVASRPVKGVILAGGKGTRLDPLTRITNKHLLPIYDRPMVTYAIEALVNAGIPELMLVTGGTHAGEFFRLLGDGADYGIERLFYAYQEREGGIAEALALTSRFVDDDRVAVVLADNVFERSIRPAVERFQRQEHGARILLARIDDAEHLRH